MSQTFQKCQNMITPSFNDDGRRLVVERVGQPVTKVVNPLGTVITILADDEDTNLKEECVHGQEYTPVGLNNVCAIDFLPSLSDSNTQDKSLCDLTEVCIETNTVSELVTDNVLDSNIKEVQEQKVHFVKPIIISSTDNSIDIGKENIFCEKPLNSNHRDKSINIYDSPIIQMKKTFREKSLTGNESKIQKNIDGAKSVLSSNEDNVILDKNPSIDTVKTQLLNELAHGEDGKKILKTSCENGTLPKKNSLYKFSNKKLQSDHLNAEMSSQVDHNRLESEIMVIETEADKPVDILDNRDPTIVDVRGAIGLSSNSSLIIDNFNYINYHVLKPSILQLKDPMFSNEFDLNVTHINKPDDNKIIDIKIKEYDNRGLDMLFTEQERNGQDCVLNNDLEHINISELSEVFEKTKNLCTEKQRRTSSNRVLRNRTKSTSSLKNELENVNSEAVNHNNHLSTSLTDTMIQLPKSVLPKAVNKHFWDNIAEDEGSAKFKTSRKRKDAVVDDIKSSEREISVIIKEFDHVDDHDKKQNFQKNENEEINQSKEAQDYVLDLSKKTRIKTIKNSASNSTDFIHINDQRKAEIGTSISSVPESHIPEVYEEICTTQIEKLECKRIVNDEGNDGKNDSLKLDQLKSINKLETFDDLHVNILPSNPDEKAEKILKKKDANKMFSNPSALLLNKNEITTRQPKLPTEIVSSSSSNVFTSKNHALHDSSSLKTLGSSPENASSVSQCLFLTATSHFESFKHVNDLEIPMNKLTESSIDTQSSFNESEHTSTQEVKVSSKKELVSTRSSSFNNFIDGEFLMDTEEDTKMENANQSSSTSVVQPSWSTVAKKNNKPKKKKRR